MGRRVQEITFESFRTVVHSRLNRLNAIIYPTRIFAYELVVRSTLAPTRIFALPKLSYGKREPFENRERRFKYARSRRRVGRSYTWPVRKNRTRRFLGKRVVDVRVPHISNTYRGPVYT